MAIIQLTASERERLQQLVRCTRHAEELRRAQALLALDRDERAEDVARNQGVGRSTVYDWVNEFQKRREEPIETRLRDRSRPGRPPTRRRQAKAVIEEVMGTDPRALGYRSPVWTTPLLVHHARQEHGIEVSGRTVRRALHELGYRYKRPRYVLSRRSPHWRQAKGGSDGA